MALDYERDTKARYKDDAVAAHYHQGFAESRGIGSVRFRWVAARERSAVKNFLLQIPHQRVLDIPAGTGKLAEIFAKLGVHVTSCDISDNMLRIAQRIYQDLGYKEVDFHVADAANIGRTAGVGFDVVVCLRLLHRVPADQRQQILSELSRVARHAIVSFGVESGFHRVRRGVRDRVFGGGTDRLCYARIDDIRRELQRDFVVRAYSWVIPVLSQEVVFLLTPKNGLAA